MKKIKIGTLVVASIIIITLFIGISASSVPNTADASEIAEEINETEEPQGTITITGTGSIDLRPDLMAIYLKIMTNDIKSAKTAKDQAAEIIDNVLKALKNVGLTEDQMETVSYNIYPKYEWEDDEFGNNKRVFKGYFVEVMMRVEVSDFDKSGTVIDASVDAGALIDRIDFELTPEKRKETKIDVLAEAARDAKLKAEAIVEALGDELGDAKTISSNEYIYNPVTYWKNSYSIGFDEKGSAPPTTILAGDLTVSGNVEITFEIW